MSIFKDLLKTKIKKETELKNLKKIFNLEKYKHFINVYEFGIEHVMKEKDQKNKDFYLDQLHNGKEKWFNRLHAIEKRKNDLQYEINLLNIDLERIRHIGNDATLTDSFLYRLGINKVTDEKLNNFNIYFDPVSLTLYNDEHFVIYSPTEGKPSNDCELSELKLCEINLNINFFNDSDDPASISQNDLVERLGHQKMSDEEFYAIIFNICF